MADPNRPPDHEGCVRTSFAEVERDTPELQRRFTIWYHCEEQRWTKAASSRLHGYENLVDFAIELGHKRCTKQFETPDSKLAELWQMADGEDAKASNGLRGYVNRTVQNAATDLRRKERTTGVGAGRAETLTLGEYLQLGQDRSRPMTGSGTVGSDDEGMSRSRSVPLGDEQADLGDDGHVSSLDLGEAIPAIAHWRDRDSLIQVLLVLHGIGIDIFDVSNQQFLGSHPDGGRFLAAFHVRLATTGHRNSAEWRRVVDALAANETISAIKSNLAPAGSEQKWWGNVRRTLTSRFGRWRNDWSAANNEDAS
jgi:hypothetical protein